MIYLVTTNKNRIGLKIIMNNVLIRGGAGYIGSILTEELLRKVYKLINKFKNKDFTNL